MSAEKQFVDTKLLRSLIPISELDEQRVARLEGNYVVECLEAGTQIFAKGERDRKTYYLLSGQVQLSFISGLEKTLNAESTLARRAISQEQPRTATAIAKTPITVLSIETHVLDDLLNWSEHGYEISDLDGEDDNDWMSRFLQSKVFLKLPAQNIQALMMRMEEVTVREGTVVIRQGDDDGYYYIIKRGRCRVTRKFSPQDDDAELAILTVGTGFGEEAILTHNRRGATVTMMDHGSLMRLSRNDFNRLLVEPLIHQVNYDEIVDQEKNIFLDVRSYDDFIEDGIRESLNISIPELRPKITMLDKDNTYVIVSNTGSRSAAAAFLLCQQGMDAVVLRGGLQELPHEVKRGNHSLPKGDEIPLINNVVSFDNSAKGQADGHAGSGDSVEHHQIDPEKAVNDPRVQAMFSRAKRRVQHEAHRAHLAEEAKFKAEAEAQRLKQEAELARQEAEKANHQAEIAAQDSAEKARIKAKKEAARLREIELGAKQAEMEEAVQQAEQEAKRAFEAERARVEAEQENDRLKQEMQKALEQAQEEARKSAEAMRQLTEQETKKERLAAKQLLAEEANRAQEAEKEIARLKAESELTRQQLEQQARIAADQARNAAEQEAARKRAEILAVEEEEKNLVIKRAEENEKRARAAEEARIKAEQEIEKLKQESELARYHAEEQAKLMVESARTKAEQKAAQISAEELAKAQHNAELVLQRAEEQSLRAQQAEEARQLAEAEIERLRIEAESLRQSTDQERLLAGQEAAKIRAEETAKKQYEVELAAQQAAQQARQQAEQEIEAIKLQAQQERLRLEEQAIRAAEMARTEAVNEAQLKADSEALRAQQAEQARLQAEHEIERLRVEAETARSQIQAQLTAEVARSEIEHEVARARAEELANKQFEIEDMAQKAEQEAIRSKQAEEARLQAETEIELLKQEVAAARSRQDQPDSSQSQASDNVIGEKLVQKQHEIEKISQHALNEAARAQAAEQSRQEAQAEIERLNQEVAVATLQAQAQLSRDAERAVSEEQAMQQRAAELEKKEEEIQGAIQKAELGKLRAVEAELAQKEAEQEISRLRSMEVEHHHAKQEIEQLKAQAGMAYVHAQEQVKASLAVTEGKAKAEIKLATQKTQVEMQRAKMAMKAQRNAENEIKRLKVAAEKQRLRAEKTIQESIKAAKRQMDKKLVKLRASEKARKTIESEREDSGLNLSRKSRSQKISPAIPTIRRGNNTVDGAPMIDTMPDSVSEFDESMMVNDMAEESAWVSDKVMWETTMGVRDDAAVEKIMRPKDEEQDNTSAKLSRTQVETDEQVEAEDKSTFTFRDTNPYVNTQRLDGVFRKPIHRFRKTLIAICVIAGLGTAGYYFSLNEQEKGQFRTTVNDKVVKNPTIGEITQKVKTKITDISATAKAKMESINKTETTEIVKDGVTGKDSVVKQPPLNDQQNDSVVTNKQKPRALQEEEPTLSFEDRVKLKQEKREKAIKRSIDRKIQKNKQQQKAEENEGVSGSNSTQPALEPASASAVSQAATSAQAAVLSESDSNNKVNVVITNPVSVQENTSADEIVESSNASPIEPLINVNKINDDQSTSPEDGEEP